MRGIPGLSFPATVFLALATACAGATRGVSVAVPLEGPVIAAADTSHDGGLVVLWNERSSGDDLQTKAWMATSTRELESLWREVGLAPPVPRVDFGSYVIFGVAGKGGVCPDEVTTASASPGGVLRLGAMVSESACVLSDVRSAQVVAVPRRLLGRRVVFVPFDPVETSAFAFEVPASAATRAAETEHAVEDGDALGDAPPPGEVTLPQPGHVALRTFADGTEVWIVHERAGGVFALAAMFHTLPGASWRHQAIGLAVPLLDPTPNASPPHRDSIRRARVARRASRGAAHECHHVAPGRIRAPRV